MVVPGMEQNLFGAMFGTLSTYPSLRFYFWDEGKKRERTRGKKEKRRRRNKEKKKNDEFARFPSQMFVQRCYLSPHFSTN